MVFRLTLLDSVGNDGFSLDFRLHRVAGHFPSFILLIFVNSAIGNVDPISTKHAESGAALVRRWGTEKVRRRFCVYFVPIKHYI